MGIAIESLLFLLGGIVLTLILVQLFNRGGEASRQRRNAPAIKLVRSVKTPGDFEETRLVINDLVILTASNQDVRLADYADEVEQLETVAARIASALGVNVELARLPGKGSRAEEDVVPVRRLPRSQQDGTLQ